jgi:putative tryptophan/tyrosine transport system substrate-binding protein
MRRRAFIALMLGAAVARPFRAADATTSKVWRMGFLAQGQEDFYDALFEALQPLGYVEGKNLVVERRYAEGHSDRFTELAAELVALKPDIIVVSTTPAALAVKNTGIPVVFPNAVSPIESGVVASFANPGGNITGGAVQTTVLSTKRLAILKEVVPGLSQGAVLWNAANPALAPAWHESLAAADTLGVKLQSIEIRSPDDIDAAFAAIAGLQADALLVLQDALTLQYRQKIIDFATERRLPGMFVGREWVIAGGLMSYGENLAEMYRRGAYYVDRILQGAKPAELPVEQVTKFELVLNLKTAKAIGRTIPDAIVTTADEVIE